MPTRRVRAMYLDPCHPTPWRKAAWHGLALVLSLFIWVGLIIGAIALYRALSGS